MTHFLPSSARPIGAMMIVGLLSFTFWSLLALLATQVDFALPLVTSTLPPTEEIDYWAGKIRKAGDKLLWSSVAKSAGAWQDPCKGWHPDQSESLDDQKCLRARQYRQIEALLADPLTLQNLSGGPSAHNFAVLDRVKQCLRGELPEGCPERPIILSGWWWTAEALSPSGGTAGEAVWMKSVVEAVEEAGWGVVATWDYTRWILLSHAIPDLIHQAWAGEYQTLACVADPRCISPEYYDPPAALRQSDMPDPSERGVIPQWRLFATDFWGSRPKRIENVDYWFGIQHDNDWSFNPLGAEWTITPYAYPGHSHLPFSIERFCTKIPFVRHEDRNDSVLIIAKRTGYFYGWKAPPQAAWSEMERMNLPFEFVSTAEVESEKEPMPTGVKALGRMSRENYEQLAGQAQVALGIGEPKISPSVYTALCQGTPVVIPYFYPDAPNEPWRLFAHYIFQHGPAAALGEPYVYTYQKDDYKEMLRQIERARDTPIPRTIPNEMKEVNQRLRVEQFLQTDWEMAAHMALEMQARPRSLDVNMYRRLEELGSLPKYNAREQGLRLKKRH